MQFTTWSAIVAAVYVGVACAATGQECMSLFDVIQAQPGYTQFGTALSVSTITLDPTQTYTILAPNNTAFGGLLSAYGIGLTEDAMRSSQYFPRLTTFLKYYILPGKYTMADLVAISKTKRLPTLFDPNVDGPSTCVDPSDKSDATVHPSDGNLAVAQVGDVFSVLDDSATTTVSNFTKPIDLAGCEGYVQLMDNILNPCAPDKTAPATSPPPMASGCRLHTFLGAGAAAAAAAFALLLA